MSFPKGFLWGAAAASYQVEGAAYEDGKGLSVWDMLCRVPGAIWNGHTGDVADDHYHRYAEDVHLMREIGLRAYRFSISWPRVIPAGTGLPNEKGLDFYDRLVDALLAAGIEPWVTLFHWDYPYDLFCRGGWLNPYSSDWFAEYVEVVVKRLSDRVRHWMTLNEPQVFIGLGHQTGIHAPGLKLDWPEVMRAWHNVLLAHGKAVQAIRAHSKTPAVVGAAPTGFIAHPATESAADIEAARLATFTVREKSVWNHHLFYDPIYRREYPPEAAAVFGRAMPQIRPGDMEIIGQPIDFTAFNYYQGVAVRAGADGRPEVVPHAAGAPLTLFHWHVTPQGLYWGPKFLYERYGKPIYITENGCSGMDWVALDGKVHDPARIDFTRRYLRELGRAIADGVDVRGYFHWSIMDNFEWAEGYKHRFGLIYVDFATQQRILKDSAYWYRDVIASNGANL